MLQFRPIKTMVIAGTLLGFPLCAQPVSSGNNTMLTDAKSLCRVYFDHFGSSATDLCYHHRLDGPKGLDALGSPADIAQGKVHGKEKPFGYGSGIQDVPLENGQFLVALCKAYEATKDEELGALARRIFSGMKRVATVSPVKGFVPRGPHPDGKSYYPDSSRDQHSAFVEAMWRYAQCPLATAEDKAFIAQSLQRVAERMEANDWVIKVEDGSRMAHVGWGWTQYTTIGAITLLMVTGATADVTGNDHWRRLYETFGAEKDGIRWRLMDAETFKGWRPFTLYSNQFAASLAVLRGCEPNPARKAQLDRFMRDMAERSLRTNVFDPACWRRLDWAGNWDDAQIEEVLRGFGLSLSTPVTVTELLAAFRPEYMTSTDWRQKKVAAKLLFGIPTVTFHNVLLSGDRDLSAEVAPSVRKMTAIMLKQGDQYDHGENMNRTVILALLLLTL